MNWHLDLWTFGFMGLKIRDEAQSTDLNFAVILI